LSADVVIRRGTVIDGSGDAREADVAIVGDRIARVGCVPEPGRTELDAAGCLVAPGFVDAHVHGDAILFSDRVHLPALHQGVTTYVIGQDGCSFAPGTRETVAHMSDYFAAVNGRLPTTAPWSVGEFLGAFDGLSSVNVAYLAPHGNIRLNVVGTSSRGATQGELVAMQHQVEQALDEGAVGLSSGLDYLPSRHADTDELTAVCRPVAEAGAVYVTHMRGYGTRAAEGLREVAEIARTSGVAAHVSHLWSKAPAILELLDEELAAGVDLTYDAYPYRVGSSLLAMAALPVWVQEGSVDDVIARLVDPAVVRRLRMPWPEAMRLSHVEAPAWKWAEGSSVAAAAEQAGVDEAAFVCTILAESRLNVGVILGRDDFDEEDVRALTRHDAHMASSDGIFVGRYAHPRGWGSFARYLGHHARELGDLSWVDAVRHLSTAAADRFGLADRGRLVPGAAADVAVFRPDGVVDRATYDAPRVVAKGMVHVLVNGTPVLRDGVPTGATPGRGLKRVTRRAARPAGARGSGRVLPPRREEPPGDPSAPPREAR
jgi:N-acyl-D-amino-acid deacylase